MNKAFKLLLKRKGLIAKGSLFSVIFVILSALILFRFAPAYFFPLPENLFSGREFSIIITDRDGTVLRQELGWRDCWRFYVPLTEISPHLIQATIAAEDQRFFEHCGVDWISVTRALRDNLLNRKICSGASTISMQTARLRIPDSPPGWRRKIKQTAWALNLERSYSKEWILEAYLNNAPYGGNIVGIEAAARKYFSKSASQLTASEAALLAGLPKSPSRLRPDRHPQRALARQKYVIQRMKELYPGTYSALTSGFSLQVAKQFNSGKEKNVLHFCRLAEEENRSKRSNLYPSLLVSSMDQRFQAMLENALKKEAEKLPGVHDGSGIIIENASCSVRALVGTLDFDALPDGQVNAAVCLRSPGSALKPFIYAAAIEKGLLLPETKLNDSPIALGNFNPQNFSRVFTGRVSARDALVHSLNTPAVRVLASIGCRNMINILEQCGFRTFTRSADEYGLALALGGGEVTLLQLAQAYSGLAREGRFQPLTFLEQTSCTTAPEKPSSPFAKGTVQLINDILSSIPLIPGAQTGIAWKTGTSNGLRDAWCCAYNRQFTVVVWLGNKKGDGASSLVGATAALPVAADIFTALGKEMAPSSPSQMDSNELRSVTLCARTGLSKTPFCTSTIIGRAVKNIPLQPCKQCRKLSAEYEINGSDKVKKSREELSILSPLKQTYMTETNELSLPLHCSGQYNASWFRDGCLIEKKGNEIWQTFRPGKHTVVVMTPETGKTDTVYFEVKKVTMN